jgi:hypothetical protein
MIERQPRHCVKTTIGDDEERLDLPLIDTRPSQGYVGGASGDGARRMQERRLDVAGRNLVCAREWRQ